MGRSGTTWSRVDVVDVDVVGAVVVSGGDVPSVGVAPGSVVCSVVAAAGPGRGLRAGGRALGRCGAWSWTVRIAVGVFSGLYELRGRSVVPTWPQKPGHQRHTRRCEANADHCRDAAPHDVTAPHLGTSSGSQLWRQRSTLGGEAVQRGAGEGDRRQDEESCGERAGERRDVPKTDGDTAQPEHGEQHFSTVAANGIPQTSVLVGLGCPQELCLPREQCLHGRTRHDERGRLPDHERSEGV